jgi:hypothetical protein
MHASIVLCMVRFRADRLAELRGESQKNVFQLSGYGLDTR